MKTITIKVDIKVPDDYRVDEPDWTLEEAVRGDYDYYTYMEEVVMKGFTNVKGRKLLSKKKRKQLKLK